MSETKFETPCESCCAQGCVPVDIQCRKRGDNLYLCGFEEFEDPSVPPRYYKSKSTVGTMYHAKFPESTCTWNTGTGGSAGTVSVVGSGGASISAEITALVPSGPSHIQATVKWTWNANGTAHRPNVGLNSGGVGSANIRSEASGAPANGTYFTNVTLAATATPSLYTLWVNVWYAFSGNARSPTISQGFMWSMSITISSTRDVWNISEIYNASCALATTNTSLSKTEAYGPYPLTTGGLTDTMPSSPSSYGSANVDVTRTKTSADFTGKEVCVSLGGGEWIIHKGTVGVSLAGETKEEDVIADFLDENDFGAWTPIQDSCPFPDCCMARWELRTGHYMEYQECEYRVYRSRLARMKTYRVDVEIYRSVFGEDDFTLYETHHHTVTTDPDGVLEVIDTVPNLAGYETYAAAACVERV